MRYELYIIEHPSKGVVTDIPGDRDHKYHFSWTKLRSDESTRQFTLAQAREHVVQIKGAEVRRWGSWEVVS